MKSLFMFITFFSLSGFVHAQSSGPTEVIVPSAPPPRPIDVDVDFQESTFKTKPWTKEFRYVAVINKAIQGREAQTLKLYEYGYLIRQEKVSTGREEWEPKGTHHSKKDMWTVTPTGFYTPTWLDKDHRSDSYGGIFSDIFGGTKMPFSIFFNGGIALHEVAKKARTALGYNVSGGCVRLPDSLAEDLFYRVKETRGFVMPNFRVDGTVKTDANGKYTYRMEPGYSALIVVINKVIQ